MFVNFSAVADDSLVQIIQTLKKIERDITDMQKIVFKEKYNQNLINNENNQYPTNEITVFDMRLRDIENELQSINLHYENITFEIEDLKTALNDLTLKLDDVIISINTKLNNNTNISVEASAELNEVEINESESNIKSQDENTLGTLKINSEDLSDKNNIEENVIYSSPEEQFQAAFDNLRNQKFEQAKLDLELFIKDNDSHKLSGSAHYWLGEIYLLQKEYREAALVFAEGYQKYPDSIKSPDSLYKLAETLIKIEDLDLPII